MDELPNNLSEEEFILLSELNKNYEESCENVREYKRNRQQWDDSRGTKEGVKPLIEDMKNKLNELNEFCKEKNMAGDKVESDDEEMIEKMFWEDIDMSKYCFTVELHNSMFLIDVLKELYGFNINWDLGDIEIYKKTTNSGIKESISRDDFVYAIQVELFEQVQEYCRTHFKKVGRGRLSYDAGHILSYKHLHQSDIPVMKKFYEMFGSVDRLNKTIDNIKYLKNIL
jgi:hypothetical protein